MPFDVLFVQNPAASVGTKIAISIAFQSPASIYRAIRGYQRCQLSNKVLNSELFPLGSRSLIFAALARLRNSIVALAT